MEQEFIGNNNQKNPEKATQEEEESEELKKIQQLRGFPMNVGSIEEFIDENHAIVSSTLGPQYYVPIMSFVDKDQL